MVGVLSHYIGDVHVYWLTLNPQEICESYFVFFPFVTLRLTNTGINNNIVCGSLLDRI